MGRIFLINLTAGGWYLQTSTNWEEECSLMYARGVSTRTPYASPVVSTH